MKKMLAVTIALTMVLLVAGCATDKKGSSSLPPSSSGSTSTNPSSGTLPLTRDKLGLGTVSTVASSKAATADTGAKAQADVVVCTVSLDAGGKITFVSIDTVQAKVDFDTKGALKTDVKSEVKSKKQLGNDYGMKKASGIGKEWFEQMDALEKYMTGKTVEEVKNMKTTKKDDKSVPDVAELKSSCTMDVTNYIRALEVAAANAK